ncbi:MAG: hypothetical protein QM664_07620 [Flavihumibacter sp.]
MTAGAPFALSVAAEDGIALRSVTGKLYAPDGTVAADQVVFKEQAGVWSNASVFAKAKRLSPGINRLELVAPGKNGDTIRTSVELIINNKPVQGHPRLFFSPASLAARGRPESLRKRKPSSKKPCATAATFRCRSAASMKGKTGPVKTW